MEIRRVPVDRLNPAAYNPRRDLRPGDAGYDKLARSMEKFGCVEPVVWNQRTGNVVGGHQRLKILRAAGETEIEVSVVDLSETDEKALNVALNKISGEWDQEALSRLLQELTDAAGVDETLTGFDPSELDALLASLPSPDNYLESFFDGNANETSPEPEPTGEPETPSAGSVTVFGLTPEQIELLTAYLDENGYVYRLGSGI